VRISLKWLSILVISVFGVFVVFAAAAIFWTGRDTTIYAAGFTEEAFGRLRLGMEVEEVYSLLGEPLAMRQEDSRPKWCYGEVGSADGAGRKPLVFRGFLAEPRCVVFDNDSTVARVTGDGMTVIKQGMTETDVLTHLGEPQRRNAAVSVTLHYTEPGGEGLFRGRIVAIDDSKRVADIFSYQFYD
jgi:outer membrane protein assembly factor BamE (lipoprotein component of BamABCDE complex)